MKAQHPAVLSVVSADLAVLPPYDPNGDFTTSPSLARALAIGCLGRLDPALSTVNIWDPAAGSGFAGSMLTGALNSVGVHVSYRGQDVNDAAVNACRQQFEGIDDSEVSHGDTLICDAFPDFSADLVIVDAPWGLSWKHAEQAVKVRRQSGEFSFGLPSLSESTWLFISLALEKLRSPGAGGGRVAALVNPGALSANGSGPVRQSVVDAGLLESVTRLPERLAPNTAIPLYLMTFSNTITRPGRHEVQVADLQTQFNSEGRGRSVPLSAFVDLESGLRTGRPGPRNRAVSVRRFIRREGVLSRKLKEGQAVSWPVMTYDDTELDENLLQSRYGPGSDVTTDGVAREVLDLDPSHIFGDESREMQKTMNELGWPCRRLSGFLLSVPTAIEDVAGQDREGEVFVPTTVDGKVSREASGTDSRGRVLSIRLEDGEIEPVFLIAWLNSEQGVSSRRRAIEASSSGLHIKALRSEPRALMRWADELVIPVPELGVQLALGSADEQLVSFQAELNSQRASIWVAPESADGVVKRIAQAFDDSLTAWLDQLPFPIASALWTAETASTPGEKQRAYIHAWEAIVAFHATVLLSASRSDPNGKRDAEDAIRQVLQQQRLGIERASFGTWVIILERMAKDLRDSLAKGDADEVARVRRAFGDLGRTAIERLSSKELVGKFKELNAKRNRWLGHTGYTSDREWEIQIASLIADLRDLRQLIGNVWGDLVLVRAGLVKRGRDGFVQSAEVAIGTRSPFATKDFVVGDPMLDGELYLLRDGSQSPLRLGHFVQLRAAPQSAAYTSYFYNRTEGSNVHLVSYQYGSDSEWQDELEHFREEFGGLTHG